jgi:translation initiation factor eIF-2B subunit delta
MSEQQAKKEKKRPENLVIPPKMPKLSKAERRAVQEAQRAAKSGGQGGPPPAPPPNKQEPPPTKPGDSKEKETLLTTTTATRAPPCTASASASSQQKLKHIQDDMAFSLFSHLPPYRPPDEGGITLGGVGVATTNLHPSVLQLGLLYAQGTIRGGNARCRAMLAVFLKLVQEYNPPPKQLDLRSHLDQTVLKPSFTYWTEQCRPHSVSMGNAFTFLKSAVASFERDIELDELKKVLGDTIQAYIRERMDYADKAICEHLSPKIVDGDVLLVYGHSQVILELLVMQKQLSKQFRVIVVDSRPLLEGRLMLKKLREFDIPCTYIYLNCISYVMNQVTKVLLGAAALMSDGSVLGRVGTACVALSTAQQRKAVLVCCETYKISNRVQLESITGNELGDPKCVFPGPVMEGENLRMLNLLYDLTPSNCISGIVTEMGILPPTSVAVLLREMNSHENMTDTSIL